ncbi:hypothetical protein [Cyanobium sp. ATX 6F1]|uniref:hypothetical protein n=1 Tax=unclassified Cyanobium TaxID=2627006 RepID=UPI0020CBBF5C|nr:hypothetical protein [Cyanobium sp. ATX 6F1]MCP9917720.1 hypothetical protein [Cyanobium sp. ATX 6F1]
MRLVQEAKRCRLENAVGGRSISLAEMDRAEADGFLEELLLCGPVLGLRIFEQPLRPINQKRSDLLLLKDPQASGQGFESPGGFVQFPFHGCSPAARPLCQRIGGGGGPTVTTESGRSTAQTQAPGEDVLVYEASDGQMAVEVRLEQDIVWLSQAQMAALFGWERSVITRHVGNVFKERELPEESNVHFLHIAGSGKPVGSYSLDGEGASGALGPDRVLISSRSSGQPSPWLWPGSRA